MQDGSEKKESFVPLLWSIRKTYSLNNRGNKRCMHTPERETKNAVLKVLEKLSEGELPLCEDYTCHYAKGSKALR